MQSPIKIFCVSLTIICICLTELYLLSGNKETRLKAIRFNMYIFGDIVLFIGLKMLWKTFFSVPKIEIHKDHLPVQPETSFNICKILYSVFILCVLGCLPLTPILISTEPTIIAMILYMSLGAFLQQIVMLFFLTIVNFLSKFVLKLSHSIVSRTTKKKIILIYSLVMMLYGLYCTMKDPSVVNIKLKIAKWPIDLQGLSMVQISDIHLGPTIGKHKFSSLIDQVMKLKPDAVVITGDLVDSQVELLKDAIEPIRKLRAPHGVYFVTGNHEYYTGDVDHWFIHLRNLGVQVLHNQNAHIGKEGNTFCLAGVDDITPSRMPVISLESMKYGEHGMDLDKALGTCKPSEAIILLSHQPNGAKIAVNSKYDISLILSGHTHGGQMFPLNIFAYLFNPYFAGLYKEKDHTYVYISQGTFYWGIPMRIGTQMEITQFLLTSSDTL